jgi:hypothetical protein
LALNTENSYENVETGSRRRSAKQPFISCHWDNILLAWAIDNSGHESVGLAFSKADLCFGHHVWAGVKVLWEGTLCGKVARAAGAVGWLRTEERAVEQQHPGTEGEEDWGHEWRNGSHIHSVAVCRRDKLFHARKSALMDDSIEVGRGLVARCGDVVSIGIWRQTIANNYAKYGGGFRSRVRSLTVAVLLRIAHAMKAGCLGADRGGGVGTGSIVVYKAALSTSTVRKETLSPIAKVNA